MSLYDEPAGRFGSRDDVSSQPGGGKVESQQEYLGGSSGSTEFGDSYPNGYGDNGSVKERKISINNQSPFTQTYPQRPSAIDKKIQEAKRVAKQSTLDHLSTELMGALSTMNTTGDEDAVEEAYVLAKVFCQEYEAK